MRKEVIHEITGVNNPLLKEVVRLGGKAAERRSTQLVVVEGRKEVSVAAAAGVEFVKVLFCPELLPLPEARSLCRRAADKAQWYALSRQAFSKISYRGHTGGIVVVACRPDEGFDRLPRGRQSVYIVLESVEKPGNLGAVCRVADAARAAGIIVCDPQTDLYNPNVIRASLGCVFTVPVVCSDFQQAHRWLVAHRVTTYAAELTAAELYHRVSFDSRTALVFGTEAFGLSPRWLQAADHRVKIPMQGVIDSLNVSTAVAILTFEAMRQRDFSALPLRTNENFATY